MKRFAAIFLTMAMLLSLVPITVWAEDGAASKIEVSSHYVCEEDTGVTNEELFAAYAQREFDAALGIEAPSFYRTSVLTDNTMEKKLYDALKTKLADIAAGTVTSTEINVQANTTFTKTELGVTGEFLSGEYLTNETAEAIGSKLNLVYTCLLTDCPYELYWHDKTSSVVNGEPVGGVRTSFGCSISGDNLTVTTVTYYFYVAKDYSYSGTIGTFTTDSAKTGATTSAVTNAEAIVTANASKSDLEKLEAYKNEICDLVSYDQGAATNTNTPYGDPWQLISVFDKVTTTNVVCEGYAKAFQYLCDLSAFSGDIECHTVTGTMAGGTGAGAHMWNVITMDDEKNYLVDVTNCDTDTIGTPDKLFMAYTANSANANQTHTFTIGSDNVVFTYDAGMSGLFCNGYLALATTAYVKPSTPSYEAQWGLATGVNSDGMPADDDWTKGTLAEAMTYANNLDSGTAYIQLLSDVNTNAIGALKFYDGQTTILDLNGKTINRYLTALDSEGSVIYAFGTLTLCDTSDAATGKITGGYADGDGGGVCIGRNGVLRMLGGTICRNTANYQGGGILCFGSFIMNGGTISENTAKYGAGIALFDDGAFTLNGGTISENNSNSLGGGVHVENGTFIMNGGVISKNTATHFGGGVVNLFGIFTMKNGSITENVAGTYGAGVVCYDGIFTMNNGSIAENVAEAYGAGVVVNNSGTFTMTDGTISKNTAGTYGAGVACNSGTFTMSGGSVSDNVATGGAGGVNVGNDGIFTMSDGTISGNTAGIGAGGVAISPGCTFAMNGGIISGNTAVKNGGGVWVCSDSTMQLSGASVISGNKVNGVINNVYLEDSSTIDLMDALGDDASIGVTTETNSTTAIVAQGGGDSPYLLTANDAAKFISDRGYDVVLDTTNNCVCLEWTLLLGDANGDGTIDIGDHQRLFEHLQGVNVITDASVLAAVDVNKDGVVDIGDHQRLFEHLQGINPLS